MKTNKKTSKITIKGIAVIFAVFLWAYVMGEVNPITNKTFSNVNVNFQYAEELEKSNIVLMEPTSLKIEVKLGGRRNELVSVNDKDIFAKIDLRGYYEGTYKIPIEVSTTSGKDFIEDYSPKEILVRFDSRIEKQFPVSMDISGKPSEGYATMDSIVKPDSVIIKGPKSLVNTVDKVIARVDVSGSVKNIDMTVPISIIDVKGQEVVGLVKEPQIVSVKTPLANTKNVLLEPELSGELLRGYMISKITLNPNSILIKGDKAQLEKINKVLTEKIDISLLSKSKEFTVELNQGDNYSIVTPQKIKVKIDVEEIMEKDFEYSIEELKLANLKENFSINKDKSETIYTVRLKGPKSVIETIKKETLTPVLDFENSVENLNKLKLFSSIPEGVERTNSEELYDLFLVSEKE